MLSKERLVTHLSATASSLSGLKVPSVSMYMALPSPPPWSIGSCGTTKTWQMKIPYGNAFFVELCLDSTWQVTASVWHNWVFPVRNSPNISVMEPVSIPPAKNRKPQFSLVKHVTGKPRQQWRSMWISELYRPCRSLSSSLEPVEIWIISALLWWNSVAVVKPMGTSLAASHLNDGQK